MSTTMTMHPAYEELADLLATARDPHDPGKPVANNTYARWTDGEGSPIAVRLHETDVVTIAADGTVTLDDGGWRTVTTKDRINRYAPGVTVWQERGEWYVTFLTDGRYDDGRTHPYVSGFTYNATTGRVLTDTDAAADEHEERQELRDAINAYARAFTYGDAARALIDGNTRGDCLYCQFVGVDDDNPFPAGPDHLALHVEEGYYVPTLLLAALRGKGYADAGVAWVVKDLADGMGRDSLAREAVRTYLTRSLLDAPR